MRDCVARGWDYSISVTHDNWRRRVFEQHIDLPDAAWTDVGLQERAILEPHHPGDWDAEQHNVVVRRRNRHGHGLLIPQRTVIWVPHSDLTPEKLVMRRQAKRGQESAYKGPLPDLDLNHPQCRSNWANQAFYALG